MGLGDVEVGVVVGKAYSGAAVVAKVSCYLVVLES